MALGAFLYTKKKDNKVEFLGYLFTGLMSQVVEPTLYGVGIRFKKPFVAMSIAGAFGGLIAGITNVTFYTMAPNFLIPLSFVGGNTMNVVMGTLSVLVAFIISAGLTYYIGFDDNN